MTSLEVVHMVIVDQIDVMLLRVVESRVWRLARAILSSVFLVRLVLELIDDEDVLAEFSWETSSLIYVNAEVKLFSKELLRLFDL